MAQFKSTIITQKGHALMAKSTTIKFTKVAFSDINMDMEDFYTTETLLQIKQEGTISKVQTMNNATVKISAAITNMELLAPYYVKVIGLYALDPDDGEILYSLVQADDPDLMPAHLGKDSASILVNLFTVVNDSTNVDLTVNPLDQATIINLQLVQNYLDEHKQDLNNHYGTDMNDTEGFHGLRYDGEKLLYFNAQEGIWEEIIFAAAYAPLNVTGLSITNGDGLVEIKWTDPEDITIENENVIWKGTKLVRKEGSYPENPTDGDLIYDNQIRNQYAITGYIDDDLTNGETYYYQLFPYSTRHKTTIHEANRVLGKPKNRPIYGVSIDTTNSDPESAVTYTDDAEGLTAGDSEWDDTDIFRDIKPCVLKDGEVQYYLNPTDFTKTVDGEDADITSGDDGDVMIEVPKMQYKIEYDGTDLIVQTTRTKSKLDGFCFYPFSKEIEGDIDKIYYPAYLGSKVNAGTENEIIRSLSGKEADSESLPATIITNLAKNRGENYIPFGFYHLVLLQVLYLLRYKNLDSQTAIGLGAVGNVEE